MMGSEHPRPEPADTWRDHAACRNVNPNLMFPADWDTNGIENAKAVCRTCPSQTDCLNYAITTRQDHGIWGGTTEKERTKLRRQRAQKARQPRPLPPINHGARGGYQAHRRRGEAPCAECTATWNAQQAEYRQTYQRSSNPAAPSWSARRVLNDLATTPRHVVDLHSQILASLTNRGLVTIDADGMAHATDTAQQAAS